MNNIIGPSLILVGLFAILAGVSFIEGCSTTEDREMMEYQTIDGEYLCVPLSDGKAYCK